MPDKKKYTDSGIEIKPVYSESDLQAASNQQAGEYPYTRGIQSDMYRGKLWTMRQYAGFSTAEESNKRYHYLLSQGVNGLSVAFDLPTQIGYDSDHAMAEGEVGKVGVAIDSIDDMETLFKGIRLEDVSTSMTINATGFILLALYVAVAKKQNADLKKITGTIQNDILKEYAARGTYIYPPKASMRIITDIFEWCAAELPKWNTISISGYHIREAGSTAVQEVAFTLSNGKAYVKAALEKGMDINVFGKRLSFFFNAHNNLFEEAAKFRAARTMWAKIMKELGATDEKAMMLRFHTQTGGSTLTAQQPLNNISRVTIQTLAAVLGGTQSLHTNGFDEAIGLPTEETAQKIIVGMNKFQEQEEKKIPLLKVDDNIRILQIEKLNNLKNNRNHPKVDQCLQELNDKASSGENMMPSVLNAVENKCTLGEIADTLREVFGEHK